MSSLTADRQSSQHGSFGSRGLAGHKKALAKSFYDFHWLLLYFFFSCVDLCSADQESENTQYALWKSERKMGLHKYHLYFKANALRTLQFSSLFYLFCKRRWLSNQSRFLLQLSAVSEIAKGMEEDRRDYIQTNEENKSSAEIMFAGDFHEMKNK